MRNVVHGLLVADHPDEHRQVRLSCFTHKTMQRLRTSRSIPSSLTFFFNSAFSRRSRASSSLSPTAPAPADLRARASQLPCSGGLYAMRGRSRAGSRLAAALHIRVSRTTLLRAVMALPDPAWTVPRVLGVDVTLPRAADSITAPCSSTARPASPSTCYPAATQRPWPAGCGNIPAPRSSAVTELVPMRTVLTPAPRTQSRSPNGSTSGRTWELSSSGA